MKKILVLFLILLILNIPKSVIAQQKIPILIYHSIDEFKGNGTRELYVTPENFKKQMTYLRDHNYTLLTFERWEDRNKVNKPIFITFDDGYRNNLNAFAIFQDLKSSQFKPAATIFVISDFIGRSSRLSNTDIKTLVASGLFSIQSHTATHPDLTKTENLKYELKTSKEKIEQITGEPVIALAYPYGNTNEQVVAETKKYYLFGLTTTPGSFSPTGIKNELYYLPRAYVTYTTTMEEFKKIVQVD